MSSCSLAASSFGHLSDHEKPELVERKSIGVPVLTVAEGVVTATIFPAVVGNGRLQALSLAGAGINKSVYAVEDATSRREDSLHVVGSKRRIRIVIVDLYLLRRQSCTWLSDSISLLLRCAPTKAQAQRRSRATAPSHKPSMKYGTPVPCQRWLTNISTRWPWSGAREQASAGSSHS